MERWKGHVAVVTGASAGIGACIAENLLQAGMKVVGLARRLSLLEDISKHANKRYPDCYYPIACDLTNEDDIIAAFAYVEKKFSTVHVLVNSAGVVVNENIIDGSTENIRKILDVNFLALTICVKEASRLMLKHEVRGHIININSIAGHEATKILLPLSAYCASKYAVTGITESLRNEFSTLKCGIKISSISPGAVRTDMLQSIGLTDDLFDKSMILDVQDVADAVLFALGTAPHVQINELKITPLDEMIQKSIA
ncbi:PREDICTED: dehydrogenase/reductase SDR family member 11-like [Ceratosolen solmsi marchali]|uniref:Dehydrogenase/reductase SDR family member 11-like n=1 Tax=Ceratosolen solmsi marchali TaxID=326594 RepID=A0AAJ7DY62_9HYME|nr:PREDICTED: dehydrogenase/reductase SDR family member 11-like [Ceratosolen solmsi marchali]